MESLQQPQGGNKNELAGRKMKRRVSQKAIEDMVNSSIRSSSWTLKIFKALIPVLPLIEDGCEETAIDLAIKELGKTTPHLNDEDGIRAEIINLRRVITELQNYADKEAVLDVAIDELAKIERKIKRLKKLRPAVRRIFKNLDPRTRALFSVHEEPIRLDGVTSLDYGDALDVFTFAPIEFLRSDPGLAQAIEAFDLACDVNEMLQ